MIKLGITGEMASGKSYCAKLFENIGVPIFYSDIEAKRIMNSNIDLRKELCEEFGNIYSEDGMIITDLLANIIFKNDTRLSRMNYIIQPYVFNEFISFCKLNNKEKYVIAESAILYESEMIKYVDKTIYVSVKEETRIKRAFTRSNISESQYHERMKNQISSEYKLQNSDFIIYNNDGDDVINQVSKINRIMC